MTNTSKLIEALRDFSADKPVFVLDGHLDPWYYDSADHGPNAIYFVTFEASDIWEIIETDENNEVIRKVDLVT